MKDGDGDIRGSEQDIFQMLAGEVDLPQVELTDLKKQLGEGIKEIYCHTLEDPIVFSDLHFHESPEKGLDDDIVFEEIPYRE